MSEQETQTKEKKQPRPLTKQAEISRSISKSIFEACKEGNIKFGKQKTSVGSIIGSSELESSSTLYISEPMESGTVVESRLTEYAQEKKYPAYSIKITSKDGLTQVLRGFFAKKLFEKLSKVRKARVTDMPGDNFRWLTKEFN